jgi:hypothetical protein
MLPKTRLAILAGKTIMQKKYITMRTLVLKKCTQLQGCILLFQPNNPVIYIEMNRNENTHERKIRIKSLQNEETSISPSKYIPNSDLYILHTKPAKKLFEQNPRYFKKILEVEDLKNFALEKTFLYETINTNQCKLFLSQEELSTQIQQDTFPFKMYDVPFSVDAIQNALQKHFRNIITPDIFLKLWNYSHQYKNHSLFKKFLCDHLFEMNLAWKKKGKPKR